MHRVLVKLVSFLPGLLALLVAVTVLTLVGALLAVGHAGSFGRVQRRDRVHRTADDQSSPTKGDVAIRAGFYGPPPAFQTIFSPCAVSD